MMKKNYRLEHLDCANCAAKMERAIGRISGVTKAGVSFLTQKLTLQVEDDADLDQILSEAEALIRNIEPSCKLIH